MIEFRLFGIKIRFRFDFFAAAAFMTSFSDSDIAAMGLLCCILHELGHVAVMMISGAKPYAVLFYGAGIMITPDRHKLLPFRTETAVLCAGCAVNFILFAISAAAGGYAQTFAAVNLFLGLFNLLPAAGLDGGRILRIILEEKFPPLTVFRICRLTGCISAVILCGVMLLLGVRNPTVFIAGAFMMLSSLVI